VSAIFNFFLLARHLLQRKWQQHIFETSVSMISSKRAMQANGKNNRSFKNVHGKNLLYNTPAIYLNAKVRREIRNFIIL